MKRNLIISFIFLATLGLLMVYSASEIWALYKNGSSTYFFIRQLIFYLLGFAAYFFVCKINYLQYEKHKNIFLIISLALLVIVLIPGIGVVRGGARSWIGYGGFSFQPTEFVKLSMIIFTASYLSKNKDNMDKLSYLFPILIVLIIVFGLIMLEPDFGTGFVLVITTIGMILLSGIKKRFIIISIFIGVIFLSILILSAPYRLARIFAFLDPWSDPLGAGFQTIQSLYAISPSGIFGRGLFSSIQKHYFLPEPQTDFIFAIIVEELGLIGGVIVIIMFFVLFYNAILISIKSKTLFGTYLAIGITISIFVQFFVNIGVVISILPVTGITLNFLSYGGSSLIMNFIMMGILVNIFDVTL